MNKYTTQYFISIGVICIASTLNGCIENDIPYPYIPAQILSIEAEGMVQAPTINNDSRTVSLLLADTVDLQKVTITHVEMTENAKASPSITGVHDFTSPQEFVLSIYQDYTWTISASQNIEREFIVKNQVGNAVIEAVNKRARVFVSEHTDLTNVEIISLVLGPQGLTTYSPAPEELRDFSNGPRKITVKYHNITEEWTLYVVHTSSNVSLSSVDAWTCVAWLYGSGLEQNENRFEIKEAASDTWSVVPDEYMISKGSSFAARVPHLKPNTEYVARAFITGETSNEITFTTGPEVELPNGSFDEWWLDGKIWQPWAEGGIRWWDTGNQGAATLGECNSVPTDDAVEGLAAKLQTRFVGIAGIGKLAAGNIFVGEFGGVEGTNGIIYLGQPFTYRPTKLKGYYKYTGGTIDYTNSLHSDIKGNPDSLLIYIALGDWDDRVEVRTNPNNRKPFDPNDPHIIAYNQFVSEQSSTEYQPFELEFEYRSTSRIPTYIIVTATSSRYGDEFTGSTTSVLYVDEFSLEYDYD